MLEGNEKVDKESRLYYEVAYTDERSQIRNRRDTTSKRKYVVADGVSLCRTEVLSALFAQTIIACYRLTVEHTVETSEETSK